MTTTPRHGFTLIELLVVISIIAVLAGMLLPAIGLVKKAALKAKFSANLRQAGLAVMVYTNEHEGITPPFVWAPPTDTYGGNQVIRSWQQLVQPYLDSEVEPGAENGFAPAAQNIVYQSDAVTVRSILHDPADSSKRASPTYGMRSTRNVAINGSDHFNWSPPGCNAWNSRKGGATNRVLASVRSPSELLLLGPGCPASLSDEWSYGGRYDTLAMVSLHKPETYGRYGSSIPLCMMDGHVESMGLAAFWEQATLDNASQTSRLFDRDQKNP